MRFIKTWLRRLFLLALNIGLIGWFGRGFLPVPAADPLSNVARPQVGAWLSVDWSRWPPDEFTIADLADDLHTLGITQVYVHVSDLRGDGTWTPTYEYAGDFVRWMQLYAPDVTLYGWLGVPLHLHDLGDVATRGSITTFARFTVAVMGFRGVHLKAQRLPTGHAGYLALLSEMRAALPQTARLSVTAHALRVDAPIVSVPYPAQAHHTTPQFLNAMAQHADQIVLLAYDSGLFLPRDYRDWVQYQTWHSAAATFTADVELIIGLSTSKTSTPAHRAHVETLQQALVGFTRGYHPRVDGVALYPHWETAEREWQQLNAVLPPPRP